MNRLLFYRYVHNVGWEYTYSWVDVYCFSSPLSWKPLHLLSLHSLSLTLAVLYKKSDLFFLLTPVASPFLYSFFTFLACAVAERWRSHLCVAHFILFSRFTRVVASDSQTYVTDDQVHSNVLNFLFSPLAGPSWGFQNLECKLCLPRAVSLWLCVHPAMGLPDHHLWLYNFSTSFSE